MYVRLGKGAAHITWHTSTYKVVSGRLLGYFSCTKRRVQREQLVGKGVGSKQRVHVPCTGLSSLGEIMYVCNEVNEITVHKVTSVHE